MKSSKSILSSNVLPGVFAILPVPKALHYWVVTQENIRVFCYHMAVITWSSHRRHIIPCKNVSSYQYSSKNSNINLQVKSNHVPVSMSLYDLTNTCTHFHKTHNRRIYFHRSIFLTRSVKIAYTKLRTGAWTTSSNHNLFLQIRYF
jgi:hypothetical protein